MLARLIVLALGVPLLAFAQVRSSSNYQILFDSMNSGGGLGTSSNYLVESTLGEQASGDSTSTLYTVRGGYQQASESIGGGSISISAGSDVALSSISGLAGGESKATTSWTVTTDNASGYILHIEATSTPALRGTGGASFADYTPTGAAPDFVFTVGASEAEFGFSPEGSHIVQRFKDNGSACDTGSSDATDRCYDALSTTPTTIASSGSPNNPTGTPTTVRFAAGVGASKIQDSGAYVATIVVTAITQ